MLEKLTDRFVLPVITRVGTAAGGLLVGSGIAQAQAEQIVAGLVALMLVVVDLVTDNHRVKRAIKRSK